jgi:hypothetical protein
MKLVDIELDKEEVVSITEDEDGIVPESLDPIDKKEELKFKIHYSELSIPLKLSVVIAWIMILLFMFFIGLIYYTGG